MPKSRGSYPHPVLDYTDDVRTEFSSKNFSITPGVESLEIKFEVDLTDHDLRTHLDAGQACLVVRWRCAQTLRLDQIVPNLVRDTTWFQEYNFFLFQSDLVGKVQVDIQIVAIDHFSNYRLSSQNEDYGNATFAIEPGDVLAVANSYEFHADKLYDPMQPPLDACFQLRRDSEGSSGIRLEYHEDEYVIIKIAPKTFDQFNTLPPHFQIASVMLPALMATLAYMKHPDDDDNPEERVWFQALTTLIESHHVQAREPLVQAQRLLENPIGRSVDAQYEAEGEEL